MHRTQSEKVARELAEASALMAEARAALGEGALPEAARRAAAREAAAERRAAQAEEKVSELNGTLQENNDRMRKLNDELQLSKRRQEALQQAMLSISGGCNVDD